MAEIYRRWISADKSLPRDELVEMTLKVAGFVDAALDGNASLRSVLTTVEKLIAAGKTKPARALIDAVLALENADFRTQLAADLDSRLTDSKGHENDNPA
jgi:hypothetical protein